MVRKIQRHWRVRQGVRRWVQQGACANAPELAINDVDLLTLEPAGAIAPLYRFTVVEEGGGCWLFDVRVLVSEKQRVAGGGTPLSNPYTRRPLTEATLERLQRRVEWLCARGYNLSIVDERAGASLSQAVLRLCLCIDQHGYISSTAWFEDLTLGDCRLICTKLRELWDQYLTGAPEDQRNICADFDGRLPHLRMRSRDAALRALVDFLLYFVQAGENKHYRCIAVMYVLSCLSCVRGDVV